MATSGAVTLVDELALSKPDIRAGVIKTLVEQVNLMDRVPYITSGSKVVTVSYLTGIPVVQLRLLNESVGPRKAEVAQISEYLTILETSIDIDPVLLDEKNHIQDLQVFETESVVASIGYRINDLFINGDPTADIREPAGLKYRLTHDPRFNGQTVNATSTTTKLPFIPGTATDSNILAALNGFDNAFYRVDNKPDAVICNQQFLLALWANLRQVKLSDTTRDNFDREYPVYKRTPFIDVGFKESGAVTGTPAASGSSGDQIIGNDSETIIANNGALAYTATTPLYIVRFGETYLAGIQQTPLRVTPIGMTDVSPHYIRTSIRWVMSPSVPFQKRAIARYVGLDVSA